MDNLEYTLDLPMEEVFAQATISTQAISHMLVFPDGGNGVKYIETAFIDEAMHMEIISIFENERINRIYENNLSELIRIGQYSIKNGMRIPRTNENLKKMVQYMRKNNYEKAFEILKADHFGILLRPDWR